MGKYDSSSPTAERKLNEWVARLVYSDFELLRRTVLRGLRFARRHQPAPMEGSPKETVALPTGPYVADRTGQTGDLLIWVPIGINGIIIDDITGGFGYSHVTVDTGEVDLPTGKPVMAEIVAGQTVERKFQDEYGNRDYARIPLSKTGIDAEAFVTCVKSKLGESYDNLEVLTLDEIKDPAKQVCSSLASDCMPETVQREIAEAWRLLLLPRTSISVHSPPPEQKMRIFISPNGFAQYYGAPKGKELPGANFLVEPHLVKTSAKGDAGA